MKLQSVRFEDEVHVRGEFRLETTGVNRFYYTLIAKFTGNYAYGSSGRADASYILGQTKTALEIWHPKALILDLSELNYEWGDEMHYLLPPVVDVPTAVVVGPGCAPAIATLLDGLDTSRLATETTGVFDNLEAAWKYVRQPSSPTPRPPRLGCPPAGVALTALLEAVEHGIDFAAGHTLDSFRADELTSHAVARNVVVVGSAARDLAETVRLHAPDVPWEELIRLRFHMLEHYDEVDLALVWETATATFNQMLPAVRELSKRYPALPPEAPV